MRLYVNQLEQHLRQNLEPVYLIFGDEPFQLLEAADSIRMCARSHGFVEREVMFAELDFDWREFQGAYHNLSLFAERRLIDLRLPTGKPGNEGAHALIAYAKHPPVDTLLLVQAGKLDKTAINSAWLKAVDRAGVVVQVWPLSGNQTAEWIATRMRDYGMSPDQEAVRLISTRVEGNLLAASQEIDKLLLLYGKAPLDATKILEAVSDSARFTIYDLATAALEGKIERAIKILHGLQAEDVKPPLVLWSLTELVRELLPMAYELSKGCSIDKVTQSVWQRRRPAIQKTLRRYPYQRWCYLLRRCAHADRIIKGSDKDKEWDELLQLILGICGQPMLDTV